MGAAMVLAVNLTLNGWGQDVVRGKVAQPSSVPAALVMKDVPLPPLDAVLGKAKNNPFIYGIYTWDEYLKHRQDVKQVGWKSIRLGGRMNEKLVDALVEDDIQVMYTWSTETKKDANPADDQAFIDNYLKGLADIVRSWAPKFKPHSFCIECWNEPDFQYLIKPDKRPQAQQEADREALYAKLLVAAHRSLQGTGIPLVGMAAGGAAAADIRFIDQVHKDDPAVARSYDILSTHPYSMFPDAYEKAPWGPWTAATSFKAIQEIMAANGTADKPVWYTEVGWQISKEEGGRYKMDESPATAERRLSTTPELQAAYTCRLYAIAQRLGVERVTNMFLTDTDGYNGGFFSDDGSWRPSAHAVQTMIRLMPAPKLVEAIGEGKDGYFAYRFQPSAGATSSVVMLWNVRGVQTVSVPVSGPHIKFIDMLGNEQDIAPANGQVSVEVGPYPVYLQTNGS
jgi:hypothetical protein